MPTNRQTVLHTNNGYGMISFVPIKKKSITHRKDTNSATTGHFKKEISMIDICRGLKQKSYLSISHKRLEKIENY